MNSGNADDIYESYRSEQRNETSHRISFRKVVYCTCITVCASSIAVICYIYVWAHDNRELQKQAERLEEELDCYTSGLTAEQEHVCKTKYGSRTDILRISAQCFEKDHVKKFVHKKIETELFASKKRLMNSVGLLEANQLLNLVSQPINRFIVHWGAYDDTGTNMSAHVWNRVSKLRHDRASYTISEGGKDTYVNGSVKLPKHGIYMINAKLTVKCLRPDGLRKRVFFEVRMHERVIGRYTTLLHGVDTGVCSVEGDFLTMFQSGLLRLSKNSRIYMQVKLPDNVAFTDYDSMYKTYLEACFVGLN